MDRHTDGQTNRHTDTQTKAISRNQACVGLVKIGLIGLLQSLQFCHIFKNSIPQFKQLCYFAYVNQHHDDVEFILNAITKRAIHIMHI